MAIVKLLGNKGKLFGLYADRFQEVPIDLKGAMLEARGRAVNTVNISPCHSEGSATKVLTAVPASFNRSPVFRGRFQVPSATGE